MEIIKNVSIIFISIFLESFPFLLLGSIVSAVIETFVSNETIAKMIPKNRILGSIVGVFLGFFIPACDCAVIPIAKRLIKKEVPLNVAVSFMLASPIINPVVLLSTYKAFYSSNPEIFYYRLILGIVIALLIGIIMDFLFHNKEIINKEENHKDKCSCDDHDKCKSHKHSNNKLVSIISHTMEDLFEIVKYLIIGALLASMFQVIIPRNILSIFNSNNTLSIIILLIFAYLVSLCSTSDSFVGKSLLSIFPKGSIIGYLLLGPMIDIKNTIVLLGNYNKIFTYVLIALIFVFVFLFSIVVGGLI